MLIWHKNISTGIRAKFVPCPRPQQYMWDIMKCMQYGQSIFNNSNPVVILAVPAPRAACLPQPRHDPIAKRAPHASPSLLQLGFLRRETHLRGLHRLPVLPHLWSGRLGWHLCQHLPSSQPQWGNRAVHCASSLWCLKSIVKGSGKSVDVDRSNFFQGSVGMGRVSFCSTVRK